MERVPLGPSGPSGTLGGDQIVRLLTDLAANLTIRRASLDLSRQRVPHAGRSVCLPNMSNGTDRHAARAGLLFGERFQCQRLNVG